MRTYGALNPIDQISLPPDTVQTVLLTGGSSGQAMDWANSTVGSTAVSAQLVRFTGMTSGGAQFNFMANLISTHAAVPASGTSITTGTSVGSTGNNIPVLGVGMFQIPAFSTGYSVAAFTSGYVMAEVWRK